MDLARLLETETPRIEWKSAIDPSDVYQAVCALANDLESSRQPGFLVLGVDRKGHPVGLSLSGGSVDETLKKLGDQLTSTKIMPAPSATPTYHDVDGKAVIVVEVAPYLVPPVVKVNGVAWVRRGTTTCRANEADLQRLNERRPESQRPFDVRLLTEATLEDMNHTALRDRYAAAHDADADSDSFPAFERWLTQKELGREDQGRWRPNSAALLVYGVDPQTYFPGAVVEFVRYAGSNVDSDVIERRIASGTLTNQIEILYAQAAAHVAVSPAPAPPPRVAFAYDYPLEVLNELIRNMVQHRAYDASRAPGRIEWYSDRIELSNPGGPYGRASEGEFGEHSDYRNPGITRLLAEEGYVEHLGRGIRRARSQLMKNGNPDLRVETDGFTRVIVERRPS
jgi:ATP-dependent DNA helicase RecG